MNSFTDGVLCVDLLASGKTILSANANGTLSLWDAVTGKEIRTFTGHNDSVSSAAFSPDGKTIVSASGDQTVRVWVASIEDILQMAEARIQRPAHLLTDAERLQYGLEEISTAQTTPNALQPISPLAAPQPVSPLLVGQ